MKIFDLKKLSLLPKDFDLVSSSKHHYALIYMILKEMKDVNDAEIEMRDVLEKLKTIAEENFEESEYLIDEIQELTGEELDEHYLDLFGLNK